MKRIAIVVGLLCCGLIIFTGFQYRHAQIKEENAREDMLSSVQAFLNTLDEPLREQAIYPLDDEERFNWHYVPRERKGVPFKSMTEVQKQAAHNIIKVALSKEGYEKASAIIALEETLRQLEGLPVGNARRDPENYAFTIFGTPSNDNPWGWRVEGHHLSLNFSALSNDIVYGTPSFMGSNPAVVPSGKEKGLQILKKEEDLARDLLKAFDDNQLKKVIILEDAPADIISTNSRKADLGNPAGLSIGEMNNEQKDILLQLLDVYIQKYKKELAEEFMDRISDKGIENIHFAWAGGMEKGGPHYYRIHGPNLLIEYDNTQNEANHVHTVVRDLENDFGGDELEKHYENGHEH